MLPPAIMRHAARGCPPRRSRVVHRCQRQLDGDAHIVADAGGRRARAAAEAVDGDDVRAAAGDAAGDGRDVVYRRDLDNHRLFVFGGLLERVRPAAAGPRWNRCRGAGAGEMASAPSGIMRVRETSPTIFAPGQMPADAGLGALAHLDLDGRARRSDSPWMHAEPAGRHLHDGVRAVAGKSPRAGRPRRCCSRMPSSLRRARPGSRGRYS